MMNRICGIYRIISWIDCKVYIGSSVNVLKRWQDHKHLLKINKHRNSHLQSSYNKYGKENFIFEILENCSEHQISEREQHWIDFTNCTDDKFGYNFAKSATHTQLGLKRSSETKLKLSISHTGKKLSPEALAKTIAANTGAKRSEAAKANLRAAQQKLAEDKRKRDKWPCPDGYRCGCGDCRNKKLEYKKNWWRENRAA